jgi:hypothetical protein
MLTQVELSNLEKKGLIKIPLIVLILSRAKEEGLKWIFQCEGENFFPDEEANLNEGDHDNWVYTNDVEASIKEVNAVDILHIIFDKGGWIQWASCNGEGLDALSDWTTYKHINSWLDPISQNYKE